MVSKISPNVERELLKTRLDLEEHQRGRVARREEPFNRIVESFTGVKKLTKAQTHLMTVSEAFKDLYGEDGYFSGKKDPDFKDFQISHTLFHRGMTVLLDDTVADVWREKLKKLRTNFVKSKEDGKEIKKRYLDNYDYFLNNISIFFSELKQDPQKVEEINKFILDLDSKDPSLIGLSEENLHVQDEIERIAGKRITELLRSRKLRRQSQLKPAKDTKMEGDEYKEKLYLENFFDTEDFFQKLMGMGAIVVPFVKHKSVELDSDEKYQYNGRWMRREKARKQTDISDTEDYKNFEEVFRKKRYWNVFKENPFMMQSFNQYFNKTSERWIKRKLDRICSNFTGEQGYELDSLSKSITHLARSPKVLKKLSEYLDNTPGIIGKDEEKEKFVAGLEKIVTDSKQKYRSKTGKMVPHLSLATLKHAYRAQRDLQTGAIDPNSSFMKDKLNAYGKLKSNVKDLISGVTSDSELSLSECEYILSSIIKKPLGREDTRILRNNFKKAEERHAAVSDLIQLVWKKEKFSSDLLKDKKVQDLFGKVIGKKITSVKDEEKSFNGFLSDLNMVHDCFNSLERVIKGPIAGTAPLHLEQDYLGYLSGEYVQMFRHYRDILEKTRKKFGLPEKTNVELDVDPQERKKINNIEVGWFDLVQKIKEFVSSDSLKKFVEIKDLKNITPDHIKELGDYLELENTEKLSQEISEDAKGLRKLIKEADRKNPLVRTYEAALHEIANYVSKFGNAREFFEFMVPKEYDKLADIRPDLTETLHLTYSTAIKDFNTLFSGFYASTHRLKDGPLTKEDRKKLFKQRFYLDDQVEKTFGVNDLPEDRKLEISVDENAKLFRDVRVPPAPFMEILNNLVRNVIDHSKGDVSVRISRGPAIIKTEGSRVKTLNYSDQTRDMVHLSITNDGLIPDVNERGEEVWSKLLEGRATTRKGGKEVGRGGIGLGHTVPKALDAAGLNLAVRSEGEGDGAKTTFTLMFPIKKGTRRGK